MDRPEYAFGAEDLVCAWTGDGLLVRCRGQRNRDRLARLHAALMRAEVAVWVGGRQSPFSNGGLCLGIIPEMPEDIKKLMLEADTNWARLEKAALATGIKAKIDAVNAAWKESQHAAGVEFVDRSKAPCPYLCLSPAWEAKDLVGRSLKTKHPVQFWLNTYRPHHFGWYTVEELEAWTRGEGPVVKGR